MLLAKGAAGVEIAVREEEDIDSGLAEVAKDGTVADQLLHEAGPLFEQSDGFGRALCLALGK